MKPPNDRPPTKADIRRAESFAYQGAAILLLVIIWLCGLVIAGCFPQESKADTIDWYPKNDPHRPKLDPSCECLLQRTREYQEYLAKRNAYLNSNSRKGSRLVKSYPPFQTQTCSGSWYKERGYKEKQDAEGVASQAQANSKHTPSRSLLPAPRLPQLGDQGAAGEKAGSH